MTATVRTGTPMSASKDGGTSPNGDSPNKVKELAITIKASLAMKDLNAQMGLTCTLWLERTT